MFSGFIPVILIIITTNIQLVLGQNRITCKPLLSTGGDISCTPPPHGTSVRNNCTTPQSVGTVASYSCKPYFVHSENSKDGQMLCRESGEWSDMEEFDRFECIEECGRRSPNPTPLIVNIRTADSSSSWPWHATIFQKSRRTGQFRYSCGGTIVQKSIILTAAHCVTDETGNEYPSKNITIMLGDIGRNYAENRQIPGVQIIQVRRIYVSEYYEPRKGYQGDIALIHLDGEIEYSESIAPICLPTELPVDLNEVKPGSIGHIIGFGADDEGRLSNALSYETLEVKSHSECFIKLQRTLAESQLCAGGTKYEEVTLCTGDSGAGFFVRSALDKRYYIQGIVSISDPDVRMGVCLNYAVLTQTFPFVFWMKDIIQRINGDGGRKIDPIYKYPFVQIGQERNRSLLTRIPREWENRVTLMKLENVDVRSDILIKSLEHAKSLQCINFTRVKLLSAYSGRKLILPLLNDVYLDILADYPELSEERIFPELIRKEFMDQFIFFSKSSETQDFQVDQIVQMNINIEIRMHIFKLIRINHPLGIISLSQIPFANDILNNSIISNFQLRQLALSKCVLDVSYLENFPLIEKLVLDNVVMDSTELFKILPTRKYLKELTLVGVQDTTLYVVDLPVSLTFLSLTDAALGVSIVNPTILPDKIPKQPSDIIFPGLSERWRGDDHPGCPFLETFYCQNCLVSKSAVDNLQFGFPNLKQIWINTFNHQRVSFLGKLKNLQVAFLGSTFNKIRIFKKTNLYWQAGSVLPRFKIEMFEYLLTRISYFWTSEGDYRAGSRLNFNEIEALRTGEYYFDGGLKLIPDGTSPMSKNLLESTFSHIPFQVQDRIHTLKIENAEVTASILVSSLIAATDLKSIKLMNISLQNIPSKAVELPKLEEYFVHTSVNSLFTKFSYSVQAQIRQYLFLAGLFFKEYFPGANTPLDYQNNILSSRVNRIFAKFGNCVALSWNQEAGDLVSDLQETNDMLRNYENSYLMKKLSYKYWPLEAKFIPENITHLNLNFAVVDVEAMLLHTKRLEDLKLINVRVNDFNIPESYKKWEWPELDLGNITHHSETLNYLAVEKAHIQGYPSGVTFTKLTTLILVSCTIEPKIIDEFSSIFPNLERIVILASSVREPFISSDEDEERILISAIKSSENLKWIQGRVSESFELRQILAQRGCKIDETASELDSIFFTLEMFGDEWDCTISTIEEIESHLLEIKGMNVFGLQPECHAYNTNPFSDRFSLPVSEELIVKFLEQWKHGREINLPDVKRWLNPS